MKQNLRFLMFTLLCAVFSTTWGETTTEYKFTISTSDFNETSFDANNNEKTSIATCTTDESKTFEVKWKSYNVKLSNGDIDFKKQGYIYNTTDLLKITSVTIEKLSYSNNFITYYSDIEHSHKYTNPSQYSNFFEVYNNYSSNNYCSSIEIIFEITESTVSYNINAISNDVNMGTVSLSGSTITATPAEGYCVSTTNPYTVTDGSATVTQDGNVFTVDASSDCTVQINFEEIGSDQPSSNTYALFRGNLEEGDYIIVYDNGAMNNNVSNNRFGFTAVTPQNDIITTSDQSIIWHIAPSGDYWTIQSLDGNKYAAGTGTKNQAKLLDDGTDDKALWTASGTSTYEFVNKNNAANKVNSNLRRNNDYGFACYATSTGGALTLYKSSSSKLPIAALPSSISPTNIVIGDNGTFSLEGVTYIEGQTYTTTWECISPNPAIISFDGDTYIATAAGEAKIKVTVTPTGTSADSYHEVYREYTVYVEKKTAKIEAIEVMNLQTGDTQEFTVSCNSDATISISSSNENIATVSNSGTSTWIVTAVGKGTATITVTSPATDNYKQAEVKFSVKVTGSLAADVIFYESFDKFVNFQGGNDGQFNQGGGTFEDLKCDNTGWTVTAPYAALQCIRLGTGSISGKAITPVINYSGDAILTFKAAAWNNNDDGTNLSISISSGTLAETSVTLSKSEWTEYTITITGMTEGAKITFGPTTNGSKHRFFLDEVMISKLETATPITATFNHKYKGFTSIYYADKNLKVPADVTAHTYKVVNGKGEYITNIPAEGVIPAGTPVMLEYGKSFTEAVTVTFEEVESAQPLNDGNMLRGSDDVDSNGLTTAPGNGKQADYYYYVLSVGKSSENANKIGFYWKLEDGGPFTPTPHKIYLALLKSEVDANNASIISIYDSDGIDSIAASDYTTQDVYSLSGVRMNGKDLPKGIYIIGGKKVVIK